MERPSPTITTSYTKLAINICNFEQWPQLHLLDDSYYSQVVKFAYFGDNLFCILKNKQVIAVGSNENGYLGVGHETRVVGGQSIKELENQYVTDIACGPNHVMARTRDGRLWGWGDNSNGMIGPIGRGRHLTPQLVMMGDVTSVKAGAEFTAILKRCGRVYVCGCIDFSDDEPGPQDYQDEPVLLSFGDTLESIRSISCGIRHMVAITRTGGIHGWGDNRCGQLGISRYRFFAVRRPVELKVEVPTGASNKFKQARCGSFTSVVVSSDDHVFQCGNLVFTFKHILKSQEPILKVRIARPISDYQLNTVSLPKDFKPSQLSCLCQAITSSKTRMTEWTDVDNVRFRRIFDVTTAAHNLTNHFVSTEFFVVPTMMVLINDIQNEPTTEPRTRRTWGQRFRSLFCLGSTTRR